MAAASTDQNFTEELGAIEQCEYTELFLDKAKAMQGSGCCQRQSVPLRCILSCNTRRPFRSDSSRASSTTWLSRIR